MDFRNLKITVIATFCIGAIPLVSVADEGLLADRDVQNLQLITNWMTFCEDYGGAENARFIADMFRDHSDRTSVVSTELSELIFDLGVNSIGRDDSLRQILQSLALNEQQMCAVYLTGVLRGMEAERALANLN